MAYHQAIPLVCSLLIVWLVISDVKIKISAPLIFVFALVSGLTYTSGSFANLSIFFALSIFWLLQREGDTLRVKVAAVSMFLPTVITLLAQIRVIVFVQHGVHRPDAAMAFPWESDFWYYLLGKVGRALSLPTHLAEISFVISVAVLLLSAGLALLAIFEYKRNKNNTALRNLSVV